jgi:hypothetical protein
MSDQPAVPAGIPRRDFLKHAAVGAAGLALTAGGGGPAASYAMSASAASYARILGANARVRVGVVGFSDRFRQALLPAFQDGAKALDFEIVALSDLWNRRRDEGVAEIRPGHRQRAARLPQQRRALRREATDAVIISTADFQHASTASRRCAPGRTPTSRSRSPTRWPTPRPSARPCAAPGAWCRSARSAAARRSTSGATSTCGAASSATS